jgi:hypothetical protein
LSVVSILLNGSIANDVLTTQFHVKEQGAAKPIHRRARRRQDESVLKKVLDIDRRFIDAFSAALCVSLRQSHIQRKITSALNARD